MNPIFRSLIALCLISVVPLSAQINTFLKSVRPLSVTERNAFTVAVELQLSSELSRVTLYYRQFGRSDFRAQEMQIMRDSAVAEIPATDVIVPFIEYYIVANTQSGGIESLPFDNPHVNPSRITVDPAPSAPPSEVLILSPEEGENVKEGETYISLSFVYADSSIDRARTKIALNGVDLSGSIVLYDDLLIIPPEAIPASAFTGNASLSIQTFDMNGQQRSTLSRGFNLLTEQQAEEIESSFQGYGNAQAESRSENIKGNKKTYNRLDARAYGTYSKFLRTNAQLTITSEERSSNQPQNRYFLGLEIPHAKIGIGDAYPKFPFTVMDGRRVRGFTADLLLGGFNLNAANGELLRRVEVNGILATLKRNMFIVRPSFGKAEQFQWGLTYMHAKDQFDAAQPVTVRPQENAVFGTDLLFAFDDRRIEWNTQAAVSLNNVDISSPEFNKDSIDAAIARGTFPSGDGQQLKKFLPILKLFITPNENLVPINPVGGTSLVYETGLSFYYFGNFLKASYLFHGKDYSSASATSLRRDIKGFNIIDRLRILDNRLFVTGSFERLSNNTTGSEVATTRYTTINTAVSYYPTKEYPNFTIGYGLNTNVNPISSDTTGLYDRPLDLQIAFKALNDRTNRFFFQTSYDFNYWGRHNTSLNIDISKKTDNTFKRQDISSFNLMLLGSTVHTPILESTIGLSFSSLEYPQVDTLNVRSMQSLSYQTITLSGRYKIYEDVLLLSATVAPTFGDLARTLFESGLQYSITHQQSAVLQFQYIANSSDMIASTASSRNDSYISLLYRIDF